MTSAHETACRQLLGKPQTISNLLQRFAPADLAAQLDLATLEQLEGSYVTGDCAQRHSDMVWRVRMKGDGCGEGEWLYVYLLLDLQSTPDRWMALRLYTYLGLMCQDLVKRGEVAAGGSLPPVLPIVLYSGNRRWQYSTDLREVAAGAPEGLQALQPRQSFLLLDAEKVLRPS